MSQNEEIEHEMSIMIKDNEIMRKRTGNEIGAEGASKISESLVMNTTLTELNLSRKARLNVID